MRSAVLLALVACAGLVLGQRGGRDNTIAECSEKVADVFFILDSSSSIYIEDYREVLNFVSQVITHFDVSRDDTRIGALTFSDDYQVAFDLDRFQSKGEVLSSVDEFNLPYRRGITNTHSAIRFVRENNRFRQDIVKVMVVITDGGSKEPALTRREADLAREAGFHMVVVGVGQYRDEQEWRDIASDPNNDYLFTISNFTFLGNLRDALPRRICRMPPIIIGGECRVRENADVLFLAGRDGENDALDVADTLKDMITNKRALHVKYIMDACSNNLDRGFEGHEEFCVRSGDAPEANQNTYVNLVTRLRQEARAMREARVANQVVVLFIDDLSLRQNRFGILQEVRNAQGDGLEIIVVDLGVRDYSNFVNVMTTNSDNIIDFYGGPQNSEQLILERLCDDLE